MFNQPNRTPVAGGGLAVPNALGMSEKEETVVAHRWDTLDRVIGALDSWGFKEATTPQVEIPQITADMLLAPDPKEFTTMFASLLHWYNYSNKLKARIVSELLQIENEMDDIGAETRKRLRRENESRKKALGVRDIEDEIETNLRHRELKIRAQEVKQLKYAMDAQCEELERSLRVVSRVVEMRKEEMGQGRTGENMPGRTNGRQERFR